MFFSKKVIGLDIGSSSIKLAEVTQDASGGITLDKCAFIQTPPQSFNNGEITDSFAIADAIRAAYVKNSFSQKNACVGLSGTAVIIKKITIPNQTGVSLDEQIEYEAAQYLPFDMSQVSLDYHKLSFSTSTAGSDYLVAVVQNDFVMSYLESVSMAKLKLKILDVASIALANTFEVNYGRTNEAIGLFNFGANITSFLVILQGEVIFSRDIPVGGFHFTNEISKNMGVTLEEAETLKLAQSNKQTDVPEETRTFMNMALEQVTDEIRSSIDFYHSSTKGLKINKVYYTGGASNTPGFIDHVSDALKLPFIKMEPFQKIKSGSSAFGANYLKTIGPFASVACGLAMRKLKDV